MRKHVPVIFLAVSLALSACSGGGEPAASDSPPPTKEEIAYYDCLKGQGVKITHTDYGAPRVDKDDPSSKSISAAQEACKDKIPPPPSPQQADPKTLAAARAESKCLREQGVAWYPDPDPVTGNIDDRAVTPEQMVELKTQHIDALRKCRKDRGDDGAVLGG
uniref:Secreted protein n=1 Tax=Streptomyces sp. NBC_00049 TaxID=2903617 RepID=A0AAU2JV68_9ACTN